MCVQMAVSRHIQGGLGGGILQANTVFNLNGYTPQWIHGFKSCVFQFRDLTFQVHYD